MSAAAALAGGLVSGSLLVTSLTLCEEQRDQLAAETPRTEIHKTLTKGVADPMTSYEVYATNRQREEGTDAASRKSKSPTAARDAEASVQATSAVDENGGEINVKVMAGTDPLTPSEQHLEEATRKAKQHSGGLKLFSGNGNMALALEIARHLGINLGKATVGRFADGEVNVVIQENVRGKDVYVIQPTCPPVNDNIMELLLMVSTLRRSSARRITVVIPYYGYARQDRKMQVRFTAHASGKELCDTRYFVLIVQ